MVAGTKPAHKPWKAEYAKSSRSSCRTCGKPIAKDAFRLAQIQPAHQFDGLMPQWHHASCVFHKHDEIKSLEEVDGLEDLRAADLQNLRKYIEGSLRASDAEVDKGKSVAPVAAPGGSDDNSGEYEIENAKSSRSVCKSCKKKIEKGHVRVATMVDNPRFSGKQPAWRHVKCFLELGWWTSPMAAMAGWDNLSVKDQAEVQELAKHSPGVREGKFVEKLENHEVGSKRKGASKSPSPKSSPHLSKIKEKIADAMTHNETSPVKKDTRAVKKAESHEVGGKRKKDATMGLSPMKSPRLSKLKEKIADAMTHKETSPVKKNTHAVKKKSPRKPVKV